MNQIAQLAPEAQVAAVAGITAAFIAGIIALTYIVIKA